MSYTTQLFHFSLTWILEIYTVGYKEIYTYDINFIMNIVQNHQ